jgi:MarR family transcriptional regulator, organic hydroperoxide resistance regulator
LIRTEPPLVDPDPLPRLGDVLDFMSLMWSVDHAMQRTSKRMEAVLGVTGPQRLVLRIVGRFPGITAGHLARLLHVHPSTLTGILKRLEQQDLIHRRSDPRDGRRSLLALTQAGRHFDVETEGTIEATIQRVLQRAPKAQVEATRALLGSISAALNDGGVALQQEPTRRRSKGRSAARSSQGRPRRR